MFEGPAVASRERGGPTARFSRAESGRRAPRRAGRHLERVEMPTSTVFRSIALAAAMVATCAAVSGCSRPKTRDDWADTPISVRLGPDTAKSDDVLVLHVVNRSKLPVIVRRVALLQVGRVSTHWTLAGEELEDAVFPGWFIQPGDVRAAPPAATP